MISIGKLAPVYSGGSSNDTPANSLGGGISTTASKRVLSQSSTPLILITGLGIIDAMGNSPGIGLLRWQDSNKELIWTPNSSLNSYGTNIFADGVYTCGGRNGQLYVNATFLDLPVSDLDEEVTIANIPMQVFDNLSAQQSLLGTVQYRCLYLLNTDPATTAKACKVWVQKQPESVDVLHLLIDPAGVNGTALGPLVDEYDVTDILVDLTWINSSNYDSGLYLGDLLPGEYIAIWLRRTLPVYSTQQELHDTSTLRFSSYL